MHDLVEVFGGDRLEAVGAWAVHARHQHRRVELFAVQLPAERGDVFGGGDVE